MSAVKIKDPQAPPSEKQIGLIIDLRHDLGLPDGDFNVTNKGEASAMITALMAQKNAAKADLPKPVSLADIAKQGMAAFVPQAAPTAPVMEQQAATLALTTADVKTILSWYPVMVGELDPTEEDELVEMKLQLFLHPLKDAEFVAAVAKPTPPVAVPAGRYAVTGEDGTTDFYKVDIGKAGGKWAGYVFLSLQVSDDFVPVKATAAKAAVFAKIQAQGILESAKRYGVELGVCGVCAKTLTDPESIAKGIGPVCEAKLGAM